MNKFLCYSIIKNNVQAKDPISYCLVGDGKLFIGPTLGDTKLKVLANYSFVDFIEECGWVFDGEEEKLLDEDYNEILVFGLEQALKKEK